MAVPSVSVVITCHNYRHFLGDCLQSVLGQTQRPLEIIVVDDASEDHPEELVQQFSDPILSYLRVEYRNNTLANYAGVLQAKGEIVCCIDADDTIDPFYLQSALPFFGEDYRVAIVYSDFEYRGLMSGRSYFPTSSLEADISRSNFIHSCSLFRREVALLTGGFEDHPPGVEYVRDWYLWKKMLRFGYWAVKQPAFYRYNRHESSDSISIHWQADRPGYYESAALSDERVTFCIPVGSTPPSWPLQKEFLEHQAWPKDKCSVLLLYTGTDEEEAYRLRRQLLSLGYDDARFLPLALGDAPSVRLREYAVMHTIANEVDSDYFLFLDECINPPLDVVEQLLRCMCENTECVTADLPVDCWKRFASLRRIPRPRLADAGVQAVSTAAFHCILFRTRTFRKTFEHVLSKRDLETAAPEDRYFGNIAVPSVAKINCSTVCDVLRDRFGNMVLPMYLCDFYDEAFYLNSHDDVREAVEAGQYSSGWEHYRHYGCLEGRPCRSKALTFDEEYYLKHNPDVQQAVEQGAFKSGYEHFVQFGEQEGRDAYFL